jgi:hypothetical protein
MYNQDPKGRVNRLPSRVDQCRDLQIDCRDGNHLQHLRSEACAAAVASVMAVSQCLDVTITFASGLAHLICHMALWSRSRYFRVD